MNARIYPVIDGALAVAGAGALMLEGNLESANGMSAVGYALALLSAAPLLFRRRAPLLVLLAVEAGAISCVGVFGAGDAALGLVMVVLFTAALQGDRRRSLILGGLSGLALLATVISLKSGLENTAIALRLLLVFAALIAGDTLRSRRALRIAARDRKWQELRQREEETELRLVAERLRIARDLHDTIAHALVAINVRAGVAVHLNASAGSVDALRDIKSASADALHDLRATLQLLRDRDDTLAPLATPDLDALPALADRARKVGVDTVLEVELNGDTVPSPVGQAAFRIVQEGVTNVLRHAQASKALVSVTTKQGFLHIDITDDGRGGNANNDGHGLRGMHERAAALGGDVVSGPSAGGGWCVRARLPMTSAPSH